MILIWPPGRGDRPLSALTASLFQNIPISASRWIKVRLAACSPKREGSYILGADKNILGAFGSLLPPINVDIPSKSLNPPEYFIQITRVMSNKLISNGGLKRFRRATGEAMCVHRLWEIRATGFSTRCFRSATTEHETLDRSTSADLPKR